MKVEEGNVDFIREKIREEKLAWAVGWAILLRRCSSWQGTYGLDWLCLALAANCAKDKGDQRFRARWIRVTRLCDGLP